MILVTTGGIGRPIDEVALNKALFDKEGVELIGVILNKVLPAKFDYVRDFARRGLARLGIDLLGCIPEEPVLANATLGQICQDASKAPSSTGASAPGAGCKKVIIGAMNSSHVMEFFQPGTLVITPGDREDVILAALSSSSAERDRQQLPRRPGPRRRSDAEPARARPAQELHAPDHLLAHE